MGRKVFFRHSNGKPQCLLRLQVISVPKEFFLTRKHTANTTEILGMQFWNSWRVTRPTTRGANGQFPRLREFSLKMCSPRSKYEKALSQLWSDWKATHELEWLMKPTCLITSADYGNYSGHRLYNQNQEKKLFCYFVGVLYIFFLAENLHFICKQTNRKFKNCPKINTCVRRATKFRSVRAANESFNCNGVPLVAARKFFLKP